MKGIFVSILKNAAYLILYAAALLLIFCVSSFLWLFGGLLWIVLEHQVLQVIYLILPVITGCIIIRVRLFKEYSFRKSCFCATAAVLVYAFLALGIFAAFNGYFKSFTPEKWQRFPNARYLMLDDLNRDHKLRERNKEEIIALLGTPDNPYDGTDADYIIDYYVGSFTIDPTMLSFEFEKDMVNDVYTYTEFRTRRQELD